MTLNSELFFQSTAEEGGDPAPDFVAHYPLTGTAEDTTGNYDGAENGGIVYVEDATHGSVVVLDGVDDYIVANPFDSILTSTNKELSVSMWVTITNDVKAWDFSYIISKRVSTAEKPEFMIFYSTVSNFIRVSVYDTAWREVNFTNIQFADLVDTHVVVIMDGSNTSLYLDDLLHSTLSHSYGDCSKTAPLYIGKVGSDATGYVDGRLPRIRIYDRAITVQEKTDIYEYEKSTQHIPVGNGLISYYPLNNNSLDNYYNQHDGTDSGGVTYDGTKATLPNGDTITFPAATGFVEAYYTINSVVSYTTTESNLNSLTNCTLDEVRKYNRNLSTAEQLELGYTA